MGADVHAFFESIETYKDREGAERELVMSVAKLSLRRNYDLFGLLGYEGRDLEAKLFPARGLPDGETSGLFDEEYWRFVSAKEDDEAKCNGYVTPATAEKWRGYGSTYKRDRNGDVSMWKGIPCYISDCDLHSVSWLTTEEFGQVVAKWEEEFDGRKSWAYPGVIGALVMMRAYEAATDGAQRCRLIFAFDN